MPLAGIADSGNTKLVADASRPSPERKPRALLLDGRIIHNAEPPTIIRQATTDVSMIASSSGTPGAAPSASSGPAGATEALWTDWLSALLDLCKIGRRVVLASTGGGYLAQLRFVRHINS